MAEEDTQGEDERGEQCDEEDSGHRCSPPAQHAFLTPDEYMPRSVDDVRHGSLRPQWGDPPEMWKGRFEAT